MNTNMELVYDAIKEGLLSVDADNDLWIVNTTPQQVFSFELEDEMVDVLRKELRDDLEKSKAEHQISVLQKKIEAMERKIQQLKDKWGING